MQKRILILIHKYFVCLFCYFTSQDYSYGHGWTVSSHFFLVKLEQAVNQYLNDSAEGRRMTVKIIFHDQSPRKYGTGPGSNSRSLDLQSDSHLLPDTLPTALRGPVISHKYKLTLKEPIKASDRNFLEL